MNIEETREYYLNLPATEICQCSYCQNYVRMIRETYPELAEYLLTMGIDIEKPFETMPLYHEDGKACYFGVQYIVLGKPDDFRENEIGEFQIRQAESHPMTDIEKDHFVIEINGLITLQWVMPEDE